MKKWISLGCALMLGGALLAWVVDYLNPPANPIAATRPAAQVTIEQVAATAPATQLSPAEPIPLVQEGEPAPSKDMVELTDRMVKEILAIKHIMTSPQKAIIVTTGIDNKTKHPDEEITLLTTRIQGELVTHATDRVMFVVSRTDLNLPPTTSTASKADPFEEGSGSTPRPANPRMVGQYALHGIIFEKNKLDSRSYLFQAKLTELRTGDTVWQSTYEVQTLN